MEYNGQQGKLCKAFLHIFCFFFLYYPVILFKLRESLGLCILSKNFFSKLNLLCNFLKLEFPARGTLEVGRAWMCKHINGMCIGGAAYVSPHEYKNTSYFCSQLHSYLSGHKKKKHQIYYTFLLATRVRTIALKVAHLKQTFKVKSCLAVA